MDTHRDILEEFKHFAIDETGFVSDDFEFSNLALVRQLQKARSVILTEAMRRGEEISEHSVQVLPCVKVCEADMNECPCTPASGCYWMKTPDILPNPIHMVSVTDLLSKESYSFVKWSNFKYTLQSRIPSLKRGRYYTIRDTNKGARLLVYNDRFIDSVAVSAIFEDPMLAAAYPNCEVQDIQALCNPLDVNFHTDSRYRDTILKMAYQSILGIRRGVDIFNDDIAIKAARQPVS